MTAVSPRIKQPKLHQHTDISDMQHHETLVQASNYIPGSDLERPSCSCTRFHIGDITTTHEAIHRPINTLHHYTELAWVSSNGGQAPRVHEDHSQGGQFSRELSVAKMHREINSSGLQQSKMHNEFTVPIMRCMGTPSDKVSV
ncbi:hypothetical protein STEG23_006927, partial [Scotinomys teguina]